MSSQLSTSTAAPPAKKLSRKQKRRKARSSSVFTATSNESSRADEELATAKAAAIRLLDQAFDVPALLEESIPTPKPKRIRFEDVPTILEEQSIPSQSSERSTALSPKIHQKLNTSLVPSNISVTHKTTLSKASSDAKPVTPQSELNSSSTVQTQDTFQVSREEIFAETALVDAFQAAMDEFKFCCFNQSHSSATIRLPQSHSEQRRTAALYYGKPPPRPTTKSKKPPLHTIFLPRLIVAPTDATTSEENGTPNGAVRQTSPVISDLDMDDYWDMVEEESE
ncbi:hypothetical protein PGT21_024345 [Puccinia graminis f. sp. tritici]|uniref:Uncharacterized protein n=1 Tax=Puccinia graminis f. sp. tritici TaxID=56615 RepID=A0A5B0M6V3_PUCGR|nr:hypothetical protein PGTUg99_022940 [Puccinia graminis f. sp. tritici]KAA1071969.1 hypothetical protein PGT21_024345 [Puccinia graminis f. sp. tritici]